MNLRILGTLLGVVSLPLWFMPFVNIDASSVGFDGLVPHGVNLFQSGQHIGGIAYLLLLAGVGLAAFAWQQKRVPQLLASGLGAAVCFLFLAQAGSSAAWGLLAETVVFAAGAALALRAAPSAEDGGA